MSTLLMASFVMGSATTALLGVSLAYYETLDLIRT